MEKLNLKQQDATQALKTLKEILEEPFTIIVRDASIQRFEYTFEAIWKFIKSYLETIEGIQAHSPKQCFRELFNSRKISEKACLELLDIADKRNETSHTYKAMVADAIYKELPKIYKRLASTLKKIKV